MAKFLTQTVTPVITQEGETVVTRTFSLADIEIDEFTEMSVRLGVSSSKFICVEGTDISGKIDPIVVPFSVMQGFIFQTANLIDVAIDGAVAVVQMGPGPIALPMVASSVEITNSGGIAEDLRIVIWGQR